MQRSLRLLALLVITLMPVSIGLSAGPAGAGIVLPIEIDFVTTDYSEGRLFVDVTFARPVPPEVTDGDQVFPVTVLVELHLNTDFYLVGQVNVFEDGAFLPIGFCVDCVADAGLNEFSVTTELSESRGCLSFVLGPFPGLDTDVSNMSISVVTLVNSPDGPTIASYPGGGETVAIGAEPDRSGAPTDEGDQDTTESDTAAEGDATGPDDTTEDSSTQASDEVDTGDAAEEAEPATGDAGATGAGESDGGVSGVAIAIGAGALLLAVVALVSMVRAKFATKEREDVAGEDGGETGSDDEDVTPGPAPATSARGPCHEERLESDEAQTAWEATVKAKGDAETAYTDAMAGGDQDAISAAHSARQEAYDAETEAYAAFQVVWNVYQDCLAGQLDSAHAPPPATETRPREPVTTPQPATAPPTTAEQTVTSTSYKDSDVEWRIEEDKYDNWRIPVGHVSITMGRTTDEFEQWLAEHGTIEAQTSDYLAWLSLPLLIIHTATSTEVEATLSLDDVDDLRDASSSQPMLVDGQLKHWVSMEVVIPTQTVGRYCERKWVREDETWRPTDETRLGELDEPIESTPIYVRDDYQTARALAEGLAHMLRQAENLETEAAQAQIDLRERCAGG